MKQLVLRNSWKKSIMQLSRRRWSAKWMGYVNENYATNYINIYIKVFVHIYIICACRVELMWGGRRRGQRKIKSISLNFQLSSTSQAMRNQTSDVQGNRMANDKNYTSKDTQTQTDPFYGDGVAKCLDSQASQYLEKQLEVDTNLRFYFNLIACNWHIIFMQWPITGACKRFSR